VSLLRTAGACFIYHALEIAKETNYALRAAQEKGATCSLSTLIANDRLTAADLLSNLRAYWPNKAAH